MSVQWKTLILSENVAYEDGILTDASAFLREERQKGAPSLLGDPRPVTLIPETDGKFDETLRQIYLRGVYGRFALLFRGILSAKAWQEAMRRCHRCFCELCEDGREFNGYMPRGILVDSPLGLSLDCASEGVDFICVDYHRLCRLWGEEAPEAEIASLWARHPRSGRAVLLRRFPDRDTLGFLRKEGVGTLFLPAEEAAKTLSLLRNDMDKK